MWMSRVLQICIHVCLSDHIWAPLQSPCETSGKGKRKRIYQISCEAYRPCQKSTRRVLKAFRAMRHPSTNSPKIPYCGHGLSELSVMFGSPPNCDPADGTIPCIGCPCCCDMIEEPVDRGPEEPLAGLPEPPGPFAGTFFFLGF